jgi:hypothetical protein
MLELFFDSSGIVYMEFIPEGVTVNKHRYKEATVYIEFSLYLKLISAKLKYVKSVFFFCQPFIKDISLSALFIVIFSRCESAGLCVITM